MIASGSLVFDICFKVSWGDCWGAGAGRFGGVVNFFFGWAGVLLFFGGVGLGGGGAPVVSIAI